MNRARKRGVEPGRSHGAQSARGHSKAGAHLNSRRGTDVGVPRTIGWSSTRIMWVALGLVGAETWGIKGVHRMILGTRHEAVVPSGRLRNWKLPPISRAR